MRHFEPDAVELGDKWETRPCPKCGGELPDNWQYEWCKACGDTATCDHGNKPHECNDCMIASDNAFDSARTQPTRVGDGPQPEAGQ